MEVKPVSQRRGGKAKHFKARIRSAMLDAEKGRTCYGILIELRSEIKEQAEGYGA
jgi:hypothetical protein